MTRGGASNESTSEKKLRG